MGRRKLGLGIVLHGTVECADSAGRRNRSQRCDHDLAAAPRAPIAELTGEFAVSPKFGLAAIAGVGSIQGEFPDASGQVQKKPFSAFELGASGRYYVLGNFDHGMQLGAELLYIHVTVQGEQVSGTGAGVVVGPFVGYKVSADFGLTFDSQLGFQVAAVDAEAKSGGVSSSANKPGVIPLLNLNVGWGVDARLNGPGAADQIEVSGRGPLFDLFVGGTVLPGFVLGGFLGVHGISNPDVDRDSLLLALTRDSKEGVSLSLLGLFVQ
jgi:hypothetical protein